MSLDDVVIVMSIPRRLVLTTRQRRGPAGAVSPPPPRPEQKPPPVVVLKRGVQPDEHQQDDGGNNGSGERSGLFQSYQSYQSTGPARFLTTGKPLPGMADLPIHGTFPRVNNSQNRAGGDQQFREREAGRSVDLELELSLTFHYHRFLKITAGILNEREMIRCITSCSSDNNNTAATQ